MATLAVLKTRTSELMNDTSFVANSEPFYNQCVNDASDEIAKLIKILFKTSTISTVSGTQYYDQPSKYISLYAEDSIVYTDSASAKHYPLLCTYDDVRKYDDLTTATGTPRKVWLQDDRIGFYPIPDYTGTDNLSVEHYNLPTTLSANGDVSDIPDKYKYAIIYYTCHLITLRNELFNEAKGWKDMALEELAKTDNTNDKGLSNRRSDKINYLG
jgi:hypothetical protein